MKRSLTILLAASLLMVSCGKYQHFTVKGSLEDAGLPATVDSILVECEFLAKQPLKVAVKDGAFEIKGKVKKASVAQISPIGTKLRNAHLMILQKGDITFRNGRAVGTPLNDTTDAYVNRMNEMNRALTERNAGFDERKAAFEQTISDFVSRHKDDPCSAFAILLSRRNVEASFLLDQIKATSPEIQNFGEVHALKSQLEAKLK